MMIPLIPRAVNVIWDHVGPLSLNADNEAPCDYTESMSVMITAIQLCMHDLVLS